MADSKIPTPKRKRDEATFPTPVKFAFDLFQADSTKDISDSPRSRVIHGFRGLALDNSGGGVADPTTLEGNEDDDAQGSDAKRQRPDEPMADALNAMVGETVANQMPQPDIPGVQDQEAHGAGKLQLPEGSIQRAYPSINRLSDSKSRRKRRKGSPPPRSSKPSALREQNDDEEDEEVEIVDPLRAALTWKEDEITIYDPEDEDDDGTGINGVGFKPTPAVAHARRMRRRQQLAAYRRREESEARARRNQRRREAAAAEAAEAAAATCTPQEPPSPSRRVRFGEPENYGLFVIS